MNISIQKYNTLIGVFVQKCKETQKAFNAAAYEQAEENVLKETLIWEF